MDQVKKYLSEIGRKGGKSKSAAKKSATQKNMAKARENRWKNNLKKIVDKDQ